MYVIFYVSTNEFIITAYFFYFFFAEQDLHSVDLDEFKYGGTNITAFRLLDPEKPEIQRVVKDWVYGEARLGRKLQLGPTSVKVNF